MRTVCIRSKSVNVHCQWFCYCMIQLNVWMWPSSGSSYTVISWCSVTVSAFLCLPASLGWPQGKGAGYTDAVWRTLGQCTSVFVCASDRERGREGERGKELYKLLSWMHPYTSVKPRLYCCVDTIVFCYPELTRHHNGFWLSMITGRWRVHSIWIPGSESWDRMQWLSHE